MKKILLLVAIAALMASCNKEDSTSIDTRVAVEFSDAAITRASGTSWTAGDSIGISMVANGQSLTMANIVDRVSNIRYNATLTGGATAFTPNTENQKIYYPTDGSSVDFYAYYPYQSGLSNFTYNIDLSDQSHPEAIDLLVAKATEKNATNPSVPLRFAHKLAKLSLSFVAGTGVTNADFEGLTVKITGLSATADYDLANDAISNHGRATNITAKTAANGLSSEAILIPASIEPMEARVVVSLLKNNVYEWEIPLDKLSSGMNYNYELTLDCIGVMTLTLKNILAWNSLFGGDGTLMPH